MNEAIHFPKLRWPLEVRMEKIEGGDVLYINCPIGVSEEPLLLIPGVAPLVGSFDGTSTVEQIASRFEQFGATPEIVTQLAQLLDKHLFLDSPAFKRAFNEIKESFHNSPIRKAAIAGISYSKDPETLSFQIDEYLKNGQSFEYSLRGSMIGIVAPHIDYLRGGISYGITYQSLAHESHDLYVLIGTSHQYSDLLFHLTAKDFSGPLGLTKCDKIFLEKLAKMYGSERSFADEFLHKQEHSLELQIPFLRRMVDSFRIVPVLVGSFNKMVVAGKRPENFDEYESFAGSLSECLCEVVKAGSRVCVLASVDIAHVGQTFGDSGQLTADFMTRIEARDRIYIESIVEQDKEKMFAHIAEDQDARRICGFPTMYTVIDVFDRMGIKYKADVFDYRQAVDYRTDCAVTFAGIGLYTTQIS